MGIKLGETARAYPVREIQKAPDGMVRDTINGETIVLQSVASPSSVRIVQAPKRALVVYSYWFAWGACPDPADPCPADLNGDGTVGILDLLQLLANWGTCCAGRNTAVPETVQDCVDKFCCESERQLALQKCLCVVDPQSCE